jgi:hypothetical protein
LSLANQPNRRLTIAARSVQHEMQILGRVGITNDLLKQRDDRWEYRVNEDYEATIEEFLVTTDELLTVVALGMLSVE